MQRAACEIVNADYARRETAAIQTVFGRKRAMLLGRLKSLGVRFDRDPDGGFYGSVAGLPAPFNTGMGFFRAALERQVITVPASSSTPTRASAASVARRASADHVRFSFGPDVEDHRHRARPPRSDGPRRLNHRSFSQRALDQRPRLGGARPHGTPSHAAVFAA